MPPMSHARADDALAAAFNSPATPFMLLHTGDPGADGTANIAQVDDGEGGTEDIVRKAIAFDAPENHPSETRRRVKSNGAVSWSGSEIDAAQEITHITIWSAETSGQVEEIVALQTPKTTGSDGVTIADDAAVVSYQVYAKPA